MKSRQNLTQDKLNSLIATAVERDVQVRTRSRGSIATGEINTLSVSRSIRILSGRFYGQHPYEAVVKAEPGLAIEVRLKGFSQSFDVDNPTRQIKVGPNDCVLTASPEPSTWHVTAPRQAEFETVTFEFASGFLEELHLLDSSYASSLNALRAHKTAIQLPTSAALVSLAARAMALAGDTQPERGLRAYTIVLQSLTLLRNFVVGTQQTDSSGSTSELAREVIEFIEAEASAGLTLTMVAAHFHVSPSLIKSRLAHTGQGSFSNQLQSTLMNRAAHMVEDGIPVARIAELLGYSSPEALTKRYSAHFGNPPSKHRQGKSERTEN